MEISSRHSSEARVHWHPAPSCPVSSTDQEIGTLWQSAHERGHTSTREPLVYLHYLAESAQSNYHVYGAAVTQCPCHAVSHLVTRHVTAHLISLIGQQLCTQRWHTTRHTGPHCHQLATQSHFTWETPGRAKLSPPRRQCSSEVPSLN